MATSSCSFVIDTIVDTDYQSYASSGRQRHILRGKHQVLRFAQDDKFGKATHCMEGSVGTGEDARLSIALQSYSGNSRSAYSIAASCEDRKSTRLNSSHANISYAVFC